MWRTAFCILSNAHSRLPFIGVGVAFVATLWTNHHLHPSNAYSHSIDTFLSGDASWVGILLWIYAIDLLNWLFQSLFWSEVSHSCHGLIPGHHSSFKYRYKSFWVCFQQIQGSYSGELSRLTYCSVRNFTSDAWLAQFTCFSPGIDVPVFYSMNFWVNSTLVSALASALRKSIGTLFRQWDAPYVLHSYLVGI